MTISAIDTGSVLYFSHDELPTVRPLTQEAVLPLIRRALAKARHPAGHGGEVLFLPPRGAVFCPAPAAGGDRRRPALLRDFRRNPSFFPFSRLSFLEFPP